MDELSFFSSHSAAIFAIPNAVLTVTLWHFGMDALCTYAGDKFYVSWEIAQHALVTVYSKDWKEGKSRVRIEKQEYPKKSLAEALEEKLNANSGGGGG